MSRPRQRLPHDAWAVTASYRAYTLLLAAYPAAFRREYGTEMAHLFRDCCREAWESGGPLALLGLWGHAVVDLVETAVSERVKVSIQVPKTVVIRAAGLSGLIAGVIYTVLYSTIMPVTSSANYYPIAGTATTMWMSSDVVAAVVPAMWLLFALALLGIHLYLWPRAGALKWLVVLAALVTCTGAITLFVSGWLGVQGGSMLPVASYFDYYYEGAFGGLTSYLMLGVGLLGTGWVALRARALGGMSWVPFTAGILALVAAFVANAGLLHVLSVVHLPYEIYGLSYVCTLSAFYLVWAIGWVALGSRLWIRPVQPRYVR